MRLNTIWSMPLMDFRTRMGYTREELARIVARKLPKRIRYWVAMQSLVYATKNSKNVPATSLEDIINNLDAPKKVY